MYYVSSQQANFRFRIWTEFTSARVSYSGTGTSDSLRCWMLSPWHCQNCHSPTKKAKHFGGCLWRKTTLSLLLKITHTKFVESVKWLTTEYVVRSPQNTADKTTVLLDQGQIRGYSDAKIKLKVKDSADSASYETAIRLFSSQKT